MPRKTHGEKNRSTHQCHSSVEFEEPLDEDRSLANWLQLPRESLVLKCNTHKLSTKGKKGKLAALLKSFFEQNHHPTERTQNAKDQDTSMADNDLPNKTPNPPQATSIPAASPIIQSIMPWIEELIVKHLSQLSSSTSQSQPGSSQDPNYSSHSSKKDGANPGPGEFRRPWGPCGPRGLYKSLRHLRSAEWILTKVHEISGPRNEF